MTLLLDDDEDVIFESRKTSTTSVAPAADAAASFRVAGGNGLSKMDALVFGRAKVQVSHDVTPTHKRPRPVASTQPKMVSPSSPAVDNSAARRSASGTSSVPSEAAPASETVVVGSQKSVPSLDDVNRQITFGDEAEARQPKKETGAPIADVKKEAAPAPAKQQMKLSDFFSKMACKR